MDSMATHLTSLPQLIRAYFHEAWQSDSKLEASRKSGVEPQRIDPRPTDYFPRFHCRHCKWPLQEAQQTYDGDLLCKACVEEILKMPGGFCACCEVSIAKGEYFPDRAYQKEVKHKQVNCCYERFGCIWRGSLEAYESHVLSCNIVDVCPNLGCGVHTLRNALDSHLQECKYRLVPCSFCQREVVAKELEMHYQTDCEMCSALCEQCGEILPLRKDLQEHRLHECIFECCPCGLMVERGMLRTPSTDSQTLCEHLSSFFPEDTTEHEVLSELEQENLNREQHLNACLISNDIQIHQQTGQAVSGLDQPVSLLGQDDEVVASDDGGGNGHEEKECLFHLDQPGSIELSHAATCADGLPLRQETESQSLTEKLQKLSDFSDIVLHYMVSLEKERGYYMEEELTIADGKLEVDVVMKGESMEKERKHVEEKQDQNLETELNDELKSLDGKLERDVKYLKEELDRKLDKERGYVETRQKPPDEKLEMDIQFLKEAISSLDGEMDKENRVLKEPLEQLQLDVYNAAEEAAIEKPPDKMLEMDIKFLKEGISSLNKEMDEEKRNLNELKEALEQLQLDMYNVAIEKKRKPPDKTIEMDITFLKEAVSSLDGEMDKEKRDLKETLEQLRHDMYNTAEETAAGHCSKLKWSLRQLEGKLDNELAAVRLQIVGVARGGGFSDYIVGGARRHEEVETLPGMQKPRASDLLKDVSTTKWYQLGLNLLDDDVESMNLIQSNRRRDSAGALQDVLMLWYGRSEKPTWCTLIRALRDIQECGLASRLEAKYCVAHPDPPQISYV